MLVDIDQFKQINASLGSRAADQLLQRFADRLQKLLPTGARLLRLSGDEFLVLLDDLDSGQAKAAQQLQLLAERLQQELTRPFSLPQQECRLMVSLGLVLFDPEPGNQDDLLRKAQAALQQSKSQGGNRYSFVSAKAQLPGLSGILVCPAPACRGSGSAAYSCSGRCKGKLRLKTAPLELLLASRQPCIWFSITILAM